MAVGTVEFALKDAVVCLLWVFCASCLGTVAAVLGPYLGEDEPTKIFLIMTTLLVLLTIFGAFCEFLGGASFSPVTNICNYMAGIGGDSVVSMGVRIPAQAVGSVLGALAIREAMPARLKHTIGKPQLAPGVGLRDGFLAEMGLTFFVNVIVLVVLFTGIRSPLLRNLPLILVTIASGVIGSGFTGPSLNPANAFGWAYLDKTHTTDTHLYVYWAAPIVGALLAGLTFRLFFTPVMPGGGPPKKLGPTPPTPSNSMKGTTEAAAAVAAKKED